MHTSASDCGKQEQYHSLCAYDVFGKRQVATKRLHADAQVEACRARQLSHQMCIGLAAYCFQGITSWLGRLLWLLMCLLCWLTLPAMAQVLDAFRQLRDHGVDVVTLGQYMRPTKKHMAVSSFLTPAAFAVYQQAAEEMGFLYVASGPMVRSSYRAGELFLKHKLQKSETRQQEGEQHSADLQ